jgi:hypothetical protein
MKVFVNRTKIRQTVHNPADAAVHLDPGMCVAGSHYAKYAGRCGPLTPEDSDTLKPILVHEKSELSAFARKLIVSPELEAKVQARRQELEDQFIEKLAQEQAQETKTRRSKKSE